MPKFAETFCSQCGASFGPGDSGFSHCEDHRTRTKEQSFQATAEDIEINYVCPDPAGVRAAIAAALCDAYNAGYDAGFEAGAWDARSDLRV